MVAPLIVAGGVAAGTLVAKKFADAPEANIDAQSETQTDTETEISTGTESESSTGKVDESADDDSSQFRCLRRAVSPILLDLARRASTVLIDLTRRAGIDRYAEAELVEQLSAQEYARYVGGTVTEDGGSVFAPDGGVDGVVHTGEEVRKIQSKHHAGELGESVLQDYADRVDVLATSNGTSPSVDPANYGIEEFTMEDWSRRAKLRLKCRRIFNGLVKGMRGVRTRLGRIVRIFRGVSTRLVSVLKRLGSAAARWVIGLTTLQQIVLAAGVVTVAWLTYQ